MKVAMIGFRGIPHTYGGGEDLARYLAPGLVEKGHEVIVYCRRNLYSDRAPTYKGVRRIFLPTIEHKFLGQFIHATLAVLDVLFRGVDIVYIHTLPSGLHSIIPWIFGKTIVVNPNGFDWERAKWGKFGKAYFRLSVRVCLFTAKEFITDSKVIRKFYLDRFNRDSSFVAYGAELGYSTNPELLNEYNVKPFEYYLVACRLVPENNIDVIVRAFIKSKSEKTLLIAGRANYKSQWIKDLYALASKDKRVRFIGHIDDSQKLNELHCNCFAYLHGHSMGGTNPSLVKALGYGNCVIAFNTPFNSEVLIADDGKEYGILFNGEGDLIEKLETLEKNPGMAAHYRNNARLRISECYTYQHIIDGYEKAFKKALPISR